MPKDSFIRMAVIALAGLICAGCVETGPYRDYGPSYRHGTYVDDTRDFRRYPRYDRVTRYDRRDRYQRFDRRYRFDDRPGYYRGPGPRRGPDVVGRFDSPRFARSHRPDIYRTDREFGTRGGYYRPSDVRGGRRLIIPGQ